MLAWAMNMGFAASPANTPAPPTIFPAPFGMGLGDELFALSLFLWIYLGDFR